MQGMMEIEPPDRDLVTRARSGDPAAFALLVRRYSRAAYAVALSVLANRSDAEDVCQDAWVRALERLDDCRHPDRFAGWLLRIVRNRALNHLEYRRVRSAEPLESAFGAEGPPGSDDASRAFVQGRLRRRLEVALRQVPDTQREVLLLHDLAGWDHRSIAGSLRITENLCRQRLFQARSRMRKLLDEQGGSS
jgi:RNA polymerase sigma-70 factor (ECF subfamily)